MMQRLLALAVVFAALVPGTGVPARAQTASLPQVMGPAEPASAADTAAIQAADRATLWPKPAHPLERVPDRWTLNEWTEAQWRATRLEQEMAASTEGRYTRVYPSEGEAYSVQALTTNRRGESAYRIVTLGKTAHTFLLQKALFRKLGYEFPPAASVGRFTLRFETASDKASFKKGLEARTAAAASRWIETETDLTLELRDVVVSPESLIGEPMPETIVPRVLADLTENANLYAWVAGTPEKEGYRVAYPEIELFQPSELELARVLYRLARLTRVDYEFVARQAQLPPAVQALVTEKLVSRAQAVLDYFEIPRAGVAYDERVSSGSELVSGVLVDQPWTGYASRFSEATPESGIDLGGRLRAFTRSKVFGLLLGVAVKKFNDLPFMHTRDYDEELARHEARLIAKQLEQYQRTGEVQKTPFGAWAYGFAAGRLILSRDVIAGSWLGTNHPLQIIDQVGFQINAGGSLTMEGGPHLIEADLGGDVAISRVYAHVKPIKSIGEARSKTFDNAAVPFLMRKNSRLLSMEWLKDKLKPGESLIITDSLIVNADIAAAAILYGFADIALTGNGSQLLLNRFHLYRRDDNTVQVHQDVAETRLLAFAASAGVRFKLPRFLRWLQTPDNRDKKTRIPLYTYRFDNHSGQTTANFYPVPLTADSIDWLRPALASKNLEVLGAHVEPVVIRNDFHDRANEHRFLFWSNRKLKSAMDLTVESKGQKRAFVRDFYARTAGRNLEKPSADAVRFLFNALSGSHGLNPSVTSINPGYTIFGRARNQLVEFEAEKLPDGSLTRPFARVTQAYTGWSLKPKKLRQILATLSQATGRTLEAPAELAESDEILLYNVSLKTELGERALTRLQSLTRQDLKRVYLQAEIPDDELQAQSDSRDEGPAEEIYHWLERFRAERSPKHLLKALAVADAKLDPGAWLQVLGGEDAIHQTVSIEGFAPADDRGDGHGQPKAATRVYEIQGHPQVAGPLSREREDLDMTEGEFLSQWITGRAL